MLPMPVARSFFGGVGICCVLPVLWMTSYLRSTWVAAQLMETQPTYSLGLGYIRRVGIPVAGHELTLTGLLFGRRDLPGRSGRVEYS